MVRARGEKRRQLRRGENEQNVDAELSKQREVKEMVKNLHYRRLDEETAAKQRTRKIGIYKFKTAT